MLRKREESITGKRPEVEQQFPKSKWSSVDLFADMDFKGFEN